MPNTANVKFKYTDNTSRVTVPQGGISFVLGPTEYGAVADPSSVITSWAKYQRLFGGLVPGNDFPLLCQKALERGAKLRVSRVVHYSDVTDASTDTTVKATPLATGSIVFSDDFVTGDSIDLEINGTAITTVNFIINNLKTLEALATELMRSPLIANAYVNVAGDGLLIEFTEPGVTLDNITVTGSGTTTGTFDGTVEAFINSAGQTLFKLKAKYGGEGYNNIAMAVTNILSDGTFTLKITLGTLTETYANLKVVPGTISGSSFLESLAESLLVEPVYISTSSVTDITPSIRVAVGFKDGANGDSVANTDYIGDSSAKNGFHAFDQVDDALQIAALAIDENLVGVHVAGDAYAQNRMDLSYLGHLANDNTSADSIVSARGTAIDSKYCQLYGGGVIIIDPLTGLKRNISELADILGNCAFTDENYAPYYSIAGINRGKFNGVLGVVNNFGTPGLFEDLQLISLAQVNMAVNKSGTNMLSGNFTCQRADTQTKFASITRGLIWLTKTLKPTLELFLEEPNVPATWNRMYQTVRPFLDGLVGKFFYDYQWQGDQFVGKVDDDELQINNAADVSEGKYKVKFIVQLIPSLQEIEVEVVMTTAGFEFNF